jgi:hypothetical protein
MLDRIHQHLAYARKFVRFGPGQSRNLSQIGACREKSPIPRDDQRLRLARQLAKCLGQGPHACLRQAIRAVARLQAQYANAIKDLKMKELGN